MTIEIFVWSIIASLVATFIIWFIKNLTKRNKDHNVTNVKDQSSKKKENPNPQK